jgi:hypothetical protein
MASNSKRDLTSIWPAFFLLTSLESAGFLIALLLIPSESGLSLVRLIMLGILALVAGLAIYAARNAQALIRFVTPRILPRLISASVLLALFLALGLFLLRYLNPERTLIYYQRAWPLLTFFLLFSIQSAIWFSLLHFGFRPQNITQYKSLLVPFASAFILLLSAFLFISLTRLGLTFDPAYWGEPGVPVMGWQLALALIIAGFVLYFSSSSAGAYRDPSFLFPLFIYIFVIILWLSVPIDIVKNGYYISIAPPTYQPFPYSDSSYYDSMAHSLLIGHPYQGVIPTRPLYIVLLAILHLLFGENYSAIISGQTILLAFIPVVFYQIGKRIHSPAVGVTVALLFVFREYNSLLISSDTRVSNTKSLLVDLPTLLLLSLACLFALRWLQQKDWKSAIVAGGAFGLLLLLRTQSMLILPVLFVVAFLAMNFEAPAGIKRFASRNFLLLSSMFLIGFILTISPWLLHNYLQVGQVTFDAPFQYKLIASQYAYTGNLDHQNFDFNGKGVGQILIEFAIKDPAFVFGFITNHFLAAEVNGLLALPLIKPYNGLLAPLNLYWNSWDGSIEWYNALLLVFYLELIALGLASAWKRLRWAGLLPLAFNIGYTLATAIGRFSGWRYDLPADWVPYFYFCLGVVELFIIFGALFGTNTENGNLNVEATKSNHPAVFSVSLLGVFILLSFLPWMAEGFSSPRYPDQTSAVLQARLTEMDSVKQITTADEIETFISQSASALQIGRVLYPRFYPSHAGYSSPKWPAFVDRDYPRVGFLLLNQTLLNAVFPTRQSDAVIPQAADAILLGCQRDGYIEVRLAAFPASDSAYLSAPLSEPCN